MFSYRHAFHAGNHADVLKHITLIATLRYLMHKDSPLTLIDTHAGAGIYRLDAGAAIVSAEAQAGIVKLQSRYQRAKESPSGKSLPRKSLPQALCDYLDLIDSFNPNTPDWRIYPGSPFIMHTLMNEPNRASVHNRLKLFELHPNDIQLLQAHVAQLKVGRRISVTYEDGFNGLKALLPPPATAAGSRRAMVLIDPSYELKTDYAKVAASVQDALRRFATCVIAVWYPIIARTEAHSLPRRLKTLAQKAERNWLQATLHLGTNHETQGLSASGMFVINAPHTLKQTLTLALPQTLEWMVDGHRPGQSWQVKSSS